MSASGSSPAVSLSQAVGALCRRHGLAELFEICTQRLGGVEVVLGGVHRWIRQHPDRVDRTL